MNETPEAEIARLRAALAAADRVRELSESRNRETVRHLRNVLAVIRALVRRTGEPGEELEQWRARLDGRIAAFARVQSMLLHEPSEGADLENLIRDELLSFGTVSDDRIRIDGPALRLEPGAGGLMALATHELAVSAAQNGAIDGDGSLSIEWEVPAGDAPVRITWTETSTAPATAPEEGSLVWLRDALAYDLGGELTCEADGGRCQCIVTLSRRSVLT